ncbi:MAG: hypothetical protein H6582_01155 [Crocinitomicaceae bacterium]|nr:hypothetical protein [Crocinitomicaceae bacterium]
MAISAFRHAEASAFSQYGGPTKEAMRLRNALLISMAKQNSRTRRMLREAQEQYDTLKSMGKFSGESPMSMNEFLGGLVLSRNVNSYEAREEEWEQSCKYMGDWLMSGFSSYFDSIPDFK